MNGPLTVWSSLIGWDVNELEDFFVLAVLFVQLRAGLALFLFLFSRYLVTLLNILALIKKT